MQRVEIVWRRLGKEHGERRGLQRNSEETISRHIENKLDVQRRQPDGEWRWWQVSDDLLVEAPVPAYGYSDRTIIYYFAARDYCFVENIALPGADGQYPNYIHIGKTAYDGRHRCWVFTDWFIDVLISKDHSRFTVRDLDDLAEASEKGIVSPSEMRDILRSAAQTVRLVEEGELPLQDMRTARELIQSERSACVKKPDSACSAGREA